jgi:inosine-uridine nucleoside N-ribohydrolase
MIIQDFRAVVLFLDRQLLRGAAMAISVIGHFTTTRGRLIQRVNRSKKNNAHDIPTRQCS